MSGLGLSALRVGKKYWLLNLGEKFEFQITETIGNYDFKVKDLNTLETYTISDLVRYGRGKDFEIRELR
ncbi:MAG: hypothetical protein RIA69_01080 [Cyclobacteriaceae bacterium]